MKKQALIVVLILFLSVSVFSQVIVLQDGKTVTYEPNAEITVTGKTLSRVLYDGVLITIPKGQKIHIRKTDGKILVSGTNLKDVKIAGKNILSKGYTIISVSPSTLEVTIVKGDGVITKNSHLTNRLNKAES